MSKLVTAIFKTKSKALSAVEDLVRRGYAQEDISLLMSDTSRGRAFTIRNSTKSAEGLANGSAIGGVLGAILGGCCAVGLLAIPGLTLYAAGQWVSLLTGFGGGALLGGLAGGIIGLRIPEHEADYAKPGSNNTGILVGVYVADERQADETKRLIDKGGGYYSKVENVPHERYIRSTSSSTNPENKT